MAIFKNASTLCFLSFVLASGHLLSSVCAQTSAKSGCSSQETRGCEYSLISCSLANSQLIQQDEFAKEQCCDYFHHEYRHFWSFNVSFFMYLTNLKSFNCSIYSSVCANRTFNFTEYHSLVYDYICEPTKFLEICAKELQDNTFEKDVLPDPLNPCEQLKYFNFSGSQVLIEAISTQNAFCDVMPRCGFVPEFFSFPGISSWTCLPSWCKMRLILAFICVSLLSIAISAGNIIVLLVVGRQLKTRTRSQDYYKLSLAAADLLGGLILFPCFLVSMYFFELSPLVLGVKDLPLASITSAKVLDEHASNGTTYFLTTELPTEYVNFAGFFTILSLFSSIYTLLVASYDRFYAIYKPLLYRRHKAVKKARVSIALLWLFGLVVSLLPMTVEPVKFGVVVGIFVVPVGFIPLVIYTIAFAVPLIAVWIFNFLTFYFTRKHSSLTLSMIGNIDAQRRHKDEIKVAKILCIMATFFTFSLLPALLVIITALDLETVHVDIPEKLDINALLTVATLEHISGIMLAMNSFWNPIIYSVKNPEFRKEAKELFRQWWRRLHFNA